MSNKFNDSNDPRAEMLRRIGSTGKIGSLLFLGVASLVFVASWVFLYCKVEVPSRMIGFMTGISEDPIAILLMINLILLILGMIMDMAALILICTPIFLPIAKSLGMAPEHFGIMLLVNLGLGPDRAEHRRALGGRGRRGRRGPGRRGRKRAFTRRGLKA